MLWIRRHWVLRTVVALGIAYGMGDVSFVNAQGGGGGGIGGGGGAGGGATSGGGGATSGGGMGGGGGARSGTGGGGGGVGGGGAGGNIGLGNSLGGSSSGGSSQTNFLSGTYSNPIYMGKYTASTSATTGSTSTGTSGSTTTSKATTPTGGIGGFGQPSLGAATGTQGGGGRLGGTAGVSTNAGRGGGLNSGQSNQGQSATRIMYSASFKFTPTPKPAAQMETELRDVLSRSTALSNPTGIEVSVADQVVTIRGKVASEDERRLAEGLLRLTPGVRAVNNELEPQ